MKRLDDVRAAIEQQLEEVLEGLRILAGIARPGEVAVAARAVDGAVVALPAQVKLTLAIAG